MGCVATWVRTVVSVGHNAWWSGGFQFLRPAGMPVLAGAISDGCENGRTFWLATMFLEERPIGEQSLRSLVGGSRRTILMVKALWVRGV